MQSVYLDYSATTPTDPEVLAAMMPYFTEVFGNPSSVYSFAAKSRKAIDTARGQVARALNADPDEIFFTGSGTEADNWALKGSMERLRSKGDHTAMRAVALPGGCRVFVRCMSAMAVATARAPASQGNCPAAI